MAGQTNEREMKIKQTIIFQGKNYQKDNTILEWAVFQPREVVLPLFQNIRNDVVHPY